MELEVIIIIVITTVRTRVRGTTLVVQWLRICLAMRETWVRSLGWEGPLEQEIAPTPAFLPGESPWTEKSGGLQSMEVSKSRTELSDTACRYKEKTFTKGFEAKN